MKSKMLSLINDLGNDLESGRELFQLFEIASGEKIWNVEIPLKNAREFESAAQERKPRFKSDLAEMVRSFSGSIIE